MTTCGYFICLTVYTRGEKSDQKLEKVQIKSNATGIYYSCICVEIVEFKIFDSTKWCAGMILSLVLIYYFALPS